MSEQEATKDTATQSVTEESDSITESDEISSSGVAKESSSHEDESTGISPAPVNPPAEDEGGSKETAGISPAEEPQPIVPNEDNESTAEKTDQSPEEEKTEAATPESLAKSEPLNDENPSIESAKSPKQTSTQNHPSTGSKESENAQANDEYAEHVTYTDDGTAIYTDPKTQHKYKWCNAKSNWISLEEEANPSANGDSGETSNPYENEHYRWCSETNQWIPKTTATASSQSETEHYKWDAEKNEWILKSQVSLDKVTYGYEDGVRTYTDKDGAVFFWDTEKKAWFPKIDDDFMARYQMSYGFIDNTSVAPPKEDEAKKAESPPLEETKADVPAGGVKRKAPAEPPKWFEVDPTQNTKVYVSNLPLDITLEEFAELMSKCGMIMRDPQTQKQKLKLYTEADGQIKGDGLCDYIKVESVELALKLLDDSVVRGNKIKVQRAKFQMRGEYNPTLKPKRNKKDKQKLLKMKEKLFDWRPEKMRGERSKHEKVVIIKNLFAADTFDKEVHLIIDYQNDLREECSKCGTVRKVVVYDRHPEGVAQVNMADPDEADLVVQMMNGRYFGKRKLEAAIWDGKTKYKVAETEKEIEERINKWDKYLETEEEQAEKNRVAALGKPQATESAPSV